MTRRLAREDMSFLERAHASRLGWGPFYAGGFVLLVSLLLSRAPAWPWAICTLGPLVLALVAWVLSRLRGAVRKAYAFFCLSAGLFFVFWARMLGAQPLDRELVGEQFLQWAQWFVTLLGVSILLGIGWWTSKTKRTEVHLEDDLRGWQEIAANFGLGMTARKIVSKDANGNETGFFVWERGKTTVRNVMNHREQLEGAMGMPEGTLRLMKHGKSTDRVDYMSLRDNPLTKSVEWPGPQQAPGGGDLSVDVPCAIGMNEKGELHEVPYIRRDNNFVANKLLGGTQGSGKSGGMTLHIADLACRSDVTQWGMDMKDGSEIFPWRAIMDNLATTIDEASEMLKALDAIMDYRGQENTRRGRKSWPITPDEPLLVVWVDELHRLLGARNGRDARKFTECIDIFTRLMTTGRALGIAVCGATQNPTLEATHSSQIRDRFNQRICFRTEKEGHEDYILNTWRPGSHLLDSDASGLCFIQDRDKKFDVPVRYFYVTDWMVEQVVAIRAPGLPLDTGSAAAARAVSRRYDDRLGEMIGVVAETDATDEVVVISDPVPDGGFEGPTVPLRAVYDAEQRIKDALAAQVAADDVASSLVPVAGENASLRAIYEADQEKAAAAQLPTAPAPMGEDAVWLLLETAKGRGASAKQCFEAAERKSSWFHRWKIPHLDSGAIVQPEGPQGPYVLAKYAPVGVSTASGE